MWQSSALCERIRELTMPQSTLGSSLYAPGVPDVVARFDVSTTAALLGLSIFILGIAFGPMLAAPMSETLGRRVVYWVSLPIFGLFTLGAGYAQNFATLLVCRFFAGFFGGPPLSIGAGTNADLFHPSARATLIGLFVLAPALGPALGYVLILQLLTGLFHHACCTH